jgi:hypothetical protein
MRLGSIIAGLLLAACPALAQEAPFYRGKTIRIVISTGVAGGYAEYARVIADHMGRHIAGQPNFLVQSMPGAGGLLATNYLYAQAPQDGTTIGIVHSSLPLTPLWGNKGVRFDTLKFNWLGSLDRVDGMCQDQGDRGIQGRHVGLYRHGAGRARWPLRRAAHRHQVDAPALADGAQVSGADPDRAQSKS